jgi:hypothetical protein
MQDEITWWDSGKALDIFGLYKLTDAEENEDVQAVVSERLKRCRLAYQSPGGWRQLIDDLDGKSLYTEHDQFQIRWKCRFLAKALDIALNKIKPNYSWEDCCKEAIEIIASTPRNKTRKGDEGNIRVAPGRRAYCSSLFE